MVSMVGGNGESGRGTVGCDAILKNQDGQRARKLAAARGHKSTAKACRRAEKTRRSTADQLWAVKLYDFCTEHQSTLRDLLALRDREDTGTVPTNVFLQVM